MKERGRMIDAIGGEAGCLRLATAFYARVATTPELRPLFPGKSFRCATEELSAFLVQFLGGDEDMTQYRWWLSLRESHARFKISEAQRVAWLSQMEATLQSSDLDHEIQDSLLQFFASASTYVVGGESAEVNEPELAERWILTQALDRLTEDIAKGRDDVVLNGIRQYKNRPSLFASLLSKMLQTRRPTLVRAVQEEIEQDPTLGTRQHAGRTLLHYAAGAGCAETVSLLLRLGIDPDILDAGGHPPLYRLANECSADTGPEIAQMLVDAGAKVNDQSGVTRCTPLHMAARRGNVALAQTLVELGASLTLRDTKGCTPRERALNCRKASVAELLRQSQTETHSFGSA